MQTVLYELQPKLKSIREKLNALSIKKALPKKRGTDLVGKGKENNLPDLTMIPAEAPKAGKTLYSILVGEATNLYRAKEEETNCSVRFARVF